ncbi:MAG: NnrU family protein [Caulobacteraceae bacterium]|nr:NnrU family protein [Caulobacteraceae bacterium]
MTGLIAAAAAFVLIHLLISGTRARDVLTARLGPGPYMGLFALASIAILAWMGFAYVAARRGEDPVFWAAQPSTKWIQLLLMLASVFLVVAGLTTPNPGSVRQEGALERPDLVKGVLRITRHPFLWGVAIWAGGHLMVNGDAASLVLFGALFVLAAAGPYSIDAKRRRALGEKWAAFAGQTSAAPFAAILQGRQSLKLGEIGAWRIGLAGLIWAGLIFVHPYAFKVSPLPWR